MEIKCNKCGHIGEEQEFPTGRDFFQNSYIAGCPKCDNSQNPGDASMRMFHNQSPFEYIRNVDKNNVFNRANEAS
ncbi:hypothetical protein LCGC14_1376890 [marine sediment metagenome]|uniref:Uncharacterized protein n=1 Tax=marine sediment metagenome TaxID=412755 RepID=A0A0F9KPP5_9ZZZZ